ncbi:MAG: class I SAM-dependent methyltransferase [Chthoniobacteraceae bacterium]
MSETTSLDEVQRAAQEQFARRSHRYGKGHILENVEDVRRAMEGVSLPPGAQALDVATGGGHTGLYVASLGYHVTLADIAAPMLERAAAAAAERGLQVEICQHPAEHFPYADASFDLVTCRVAPHHFSSPESFVKETARVLKPKGYFVLIDGTVEDDQPEAEEWAHHLEKLRDPSHHRFLTPRTWQGLCEKVGLKIQTATLTPRKQPDLDWYFETAATPSENRIAVRELIRTAPENARRLFQLAEEQGRTIWWWQMLTLVTRKG